MAAIVGWHHPVSQKKKFKATLLAGKVMATVFWDAEGVILVDNIMWSNNQLRCALFYVIHTVHFLTFNILTNRMH
jgi:hypothetical protein